MAKGVTEERDLANTAVDALLTEMIRFLLFFNYMFEVKESPKKYFPTKHWKRYIHVFMNDLSHEVNCRGFVKDFKPLVKWTSDF